MVKDKIKTLPSIDNLSSDAMRYMQTVIKGKNDPIWFIENVLDVKMFPKQAEITREFYKHKYLNEKTPYYKTLVLGLGMRSGKTALGGMLAAYELFDIMTLDSPSEYYGLLKNQPIMIPVVAPSERQVTDGVFYNVANILENSEWITSWTDLQFRSEEIFSPSKHLAIKPFSSWATSGRGATSKCVILDELDLFETTTSKRGATEVYNALTKSTATLGMDGHIFALSSLMSPTSIMSTLIKKAEMDREANPTTFKTLAYKIPTWEANPHISFKQLEEEFKFDMPTLWRDYGCKPEMWNALEFPRGVNLKQFPNALLEPNCAAPNKMRVMAIDPAVRNDSFGVAVGYKTEDGKIIVDGATKFRRKDGEPIIKPSDIKNFINSMCNNLNVYALVFDVWMFPDIIEDAQLQGLITEKHIVYKEDYDLVKSLMDANKLDVVYDTELKIEFEQLEVKGGTKPRVDHPVSGGKDIADCVANVVWYLSSRESIEPVYNFTSITTF